MQTQPTGRTMSRIRAWGLLFCKTKILSGPLEFTTDLQELMTLTARPRDVQDHDETLETQWCLY